MQPRVVAGVRESGLMGTLTLKLTFKRVGAAGVAVSGKITEKIPRSQIQAVEMFADENHNLYEENPAQMNFDNVHVIDKQKKVNQI